MGDLHRSGAARVTLGLGQPRRPDMTATCAQLTAGVDVKQTLPIATGEVGIRLLSHLISASA
jgi:hypothetical protein